MIKHQGGCHCGQIKFTTEYEPLLVPFCNCNKCRKLIGSISLSCVYAFEEVTIQGDMLTYDYVGGSGHTVHANVCNKCYTLVWRQSEAYSDFIFIPVGCFSDPHAFPPTIEIFTDFKLKWLRDDGCIKTKVADEGYIERFQEMIANAERLR